MTKSNRKNRFLPMAHSVRGDKIWRKKRTPFCVGEAGYRKMNISYTQAGNCITGFLYLEGSFIIFTIRHVMNTNIYW